MPIVSRTNNRVLPTNSRAVDVAVRTIQAVADTQRLKYHNAFKVQGYEAVLYHRLTCGLQCSCQNRSLALPKRLDSSGEATDGFMNELLTGGLSFNTSRYGQRTADQPSHVASTASLFDTLPIEQDDPLVTQALSSSTTLFRISQDVEDDTSTFASGLFEDDVKGLSRPQVGTLSDVFGSSAEQGVTTVVSSGIGPNGIVHDLEFEDVIPDLEDSDIGYMGVSERSCPICFGTGYVGGFSVYNGWRKVLNHQDAELVLSSDGSVLFDESPVALQATYAEWPILLPFGALSVDALNVRSYLDVLPARISIDGQLLDSAHQLISFCDGKAHVLRVTFDKPTRFTHVEIQVNQSDKIPYLDFPETTKSSVMSSLENMMDFSLVVSPIVPTISPGDYIADSVHGKVLQVKSAAQKNDNRMTIFGWSCDVRVTQPKELVSLLPRRLLSTLPQPRHPSLPRHQDRWHT